MKFLADIPIGRATVDFLVQSGHDCATVLDRLHPAAEDRDIVALAAAENRVIICFDLDFSALVGLSGRTAPSVLTFRTDRHSAEYLNSRLAAILPEVAEHLERGVLATVEDARVRIRDLPVPGRQPP